MRFNSPILAAAFVAVGLTACGGNSAPANLPSAALDGGAPVRAEASHYKVLHRLMDPVNGLRPDRGLIDVDGTLYGVTDSGGDHVCGTGHTYCGTVFSVTTSGVQKTLYRFQGGTDGQAPHGRLLDVDGVLYGTTAVGGDGCMIGHKKAGCGTVFSVTTAGVEKVLYRFTGNADGAEPNAGLNDVNGVLYGTTSLGGNPSGSKSKNGCYQIFRGCGTVYTIDTAGHEKVIHRFARPDGVMPVSGLLNLDGTLYGTTPDGGAADRGTVYSITPSGTEKVIYSFEAAPDASQPSAELTDVSGVLYGPAGGGKDNAGSIFSLTTAGVENVVYSFGNVGGHGLENPLTYFDDKLYVATVNGGYGRAGGYGTLYSVTLDGKAKQLHEFGGGADGCAPSSGLRELNGTLYGVTLHGGNPSKGCPLHTGGTIYSWTP